jgi:hypothetical protein
MNRQRRHNRGLPSRMVLNHGAYYFLEPAGWRKNKWIPLGKDYPEALKKYAVLLAGSQRREGTMGDLIARWKADELPRYAVKTRAEYARMTTQIGDAFQEFDAEQVRGKDVADFVRQWKDKPNTANKYKAVLSLLFSYAVSVLGLRQDNPCREVRSLKESKRDRYITDEELIATVLVPSQVAMACLIALAR